ALRAVENGLSPSPAAAADLGLAIRASVLGGRAACAYYGGPLRIARKGSEGPVTAADHASNRAIAACLAEARPGETVLSEESVAPEESRLQGRLWVVDPLDGTKEFIAENGEFSVMVGLAVEGRALAGAVYQPGIGRVFAGIVEEGAWVLEEDEGAWLAAALALDPESDPATPLRFARSRSHPDERLAELARELAPIEEVVSGSVGIKCALVATGAADLYVHPVPYLKEWDTCAPEAVLRGAGGRVTDCAGRDLRYGKSERRQNGGIFAGTPAAWRRVRPIVEKTTRNMFTGTTT
ncbi:MAG: 3'(2'),5'-bisphosphate nucleotidase CysQ, partial [Gemmatimonadota bacterium]|nr:3'(2'),5'-bisphosphate nucleotidase CysQ [Gemmatimonadota bacterium]